MKRASYREAIDWIAQNDSPADLGANDPVRVGELVSSVLIASIFGVEPERVGRDVVRCRIRYGIVSALNNEDAQ
jgi:hypothetical protein